MEERTDIYSDFEKELEHLINHYSLENGSSTPDFILANYLRNCLVTFNQTISSRDEWHGFKPFDNLTEVSDLAATDSQSQIEPLKSAINPPSDPKRKANT